MALGDAWWLMACAEALFAAIHEESKGRLKIEDHCDSTLATGFDALRTLQEKRVADKGIVVPEYTANDLSPYQIFKSFPSVSTAGSRCDSHYCGLAWL
jgi:hypothetical protein